MTDKCYYLHTELNKEDETLILTHASVLFHTFVTQCFCSSLSILLCKKVYILFAVLLTSEGHV